MPNSSDIKRALRQAGFEVYRTHEGTVHLAERPRENLIMDSGVRVHIAELAVSFYARSEQRDFPGECAEELLERARKLGEPAVTRGYSERRVFVTEMPDPGDPERILDLWHQVQFEKQVDSIEEAMEEVRFAISLDKTAKR
jgi:hypothetical protein